MTTIYNPIVLSKVAISYLFDVNRIWKSNEKELRKYRDKAFRKIVKFAYNSVPLYHEKYKAAGVHPNEIKGTKDIKKLPFVTKNNLREYFPDGIIPKGFDKKNGFLMSTSGATGKPIFVYCDVLSAIKRLELLIRELKAYGGNWKKSKIALIIDLNPGSVESTVLAESTMPLIKNFISLDNLRYLSFNEKTEILIKKIDEFSPEFLGSDPNILRELALLKNEGCGQNIQPNYIISSGAFLDSYTKNYVEKAFETRVLDVYGSTEAGSLAFECLKGNYHVHSDFVFLEILDEEKNPVKSGKSGNLVVTTLYGRGTPIIRYTGNEDFLTSVEQKCDCGIKTEIIKKIEGRTTDMIILPNGKMLSPLTLTGIPGKIMEKNKTCKIKQFQIIQHKLDEIELKIIIDEKLRNIGITVHDLKKELKNEFSKKIGDDIKIFVNESDEIRTDKGTNKVKVVISKIKK
ncbi:MAG: phenylacetate--CoA ligase family protein [Thermoplasmatales archaeon]|nr:phenylacetate--CoA ligase family protein [Thermoplasmatales archaeon]